MKGFTLIELLIVIAILAILTTTVVLVLNPAQMLAEARDSQRMADLDSTRSAIVLYLATFASPDVTFGVSGDAARCMAGTTNPFIITPCTINATTAVDGMGWVLVNLMDATGGSPLAVLPQDPINNATYFYAYAADESENTFELNCKLESTNYSPRMTADGGNNADFYEIGTDPGLNL